MFASRWSCSKQMVFVTNASSQQRETPGTHTHAHTHTISLWLCPSVNLEGKRDVQQKWLADFRIKMEKTMKSVQLERILWNDRKHKKSVSSVCGIWLYTKANSAKRHFFFYSPFLRICPFLSIFLFFLIHWLHASSHFICFKYYAGLE